MDQKLFLAFVVGKPYHDEESFGPDPGMKNFTRVVWGATEKDAEQRVREHFERADVLILDIVLIEAIS